MAEKKKEAPRGGEPERDNAVTSPPLLVQAMSLLEDYTPIKPVLGKDVNSFEDAMFKGGLFGAPQELVWTAVIIGVVYGIMVAVL
ncbi:MAG: hypothetical protein AB1626_03205 [Candidatus Micrarchaeota archaeon]